MRIVIESRETNTDLGRAIFIVDESGPTPLGADPAISGQNEGQEQDAGLLKPGR